MDTKRIPGKTGPAQKLPLNSKPDVKNLSELPKTTFVVSIDTDTSFTAPFRVRPDASAARGFSLVLLEGEGNQESLGVGSATLSVNVDKAGTYDLWLHCLWRDSCSNSVRVNLADAPIFRTCESNIFNSWNWVNAGQYELKAGANTLVIKEREDGIAIDQILVSADESYIPTAVFSDGSDDGFSLRRFADSFDRSPGHGLDPWIVISGNWKINFSFDPNRIPYQYALTASAKENDEESIIIHRDKWPGNAFRFHIFAENPGTYGAIIDTNTRLEFKCGSEESTLTLVSKKRRDSIQLKSFELKQWYRIDVESWASVCTVRIDGHRVMQFLDLEFEEKSPGFFVQSGRCAFDDTFLESIDWISDNGKQQIDWGGNSDLMRTKINDRKIISGKGVLEIPKRGDGLAELILAGKGRALSFNRPAESSTTVKKNDGTEMQVYEFLGQRPVNIKFKESVQIPQILLRYRQKHSDIYSIGPYHFTKSHLLDSSDYLDFTAEEYAEMKESTDTDKTRRKARMRPVLGEENKAAWTVKNREWQRSGGSLVNTKDFATITHNQEINGPFKLSMRVKLAEKSKLIVLLNIIGLKNRKITMAADLVADFAIAADDSWHDVFIENGLNSCRVLLDGKEVFKKDMPSTLGSRIKMIAHSGTVALDDIEFIIERHGPEHHFYGFDKRESDWLYTGKADWLDHGGIACAFASSWVSLDASKEPGLLWNKRKFTGDTLLVATNIEENGEWFGWAKGHTHHAYENIQVSLSPEHDVNKGYRLELCTEDRTKTTLYRNGKSVHEIKQIGDFPLRYQGGHTPYAPRKSRLTFSKQGSHIIAILNGKQIMDWVDSEPLDVSRVAIGAYETRVNFTNIQVIGKEKKKTD
ncbi:MAG: hypothetical protein HRT89_02905 [Lentisphaeria bacterium]|nr:hypothetical protein [Lentisphaeria bacterium]